MLPSILYVRPVPVGAVTLMVPVATVQLGCCRLTVGAAGAVVLLKTVVVARAVQPLAVVTITE